MSVKNRKFNDQWRNAFQHGQATKLWMVLSLDILSAVLLVCAIALAVFSYWQKMTHKPKQLSVSINETVARSIPASFTQKDWKPFETYESDFSSKDLFVSPEEKALTSIVTPVQAPVVSATVQWGEGYQLAGVIVDQAPMAIVKTSNPPGVVTVTVGEKLGDAVLVKVQENQAVFKYQEQLFTLVLEDKNVNGQQDAQKL